MSCPSRRGPHPQNVSSRDPVENALAAATAWLHDERDLGRAIAAESIDRDPIGFLDAMGGLWLIIGDVTSEEHIDVRQVVADVALGVAQAASERTSTHPTPPPSEEP